LPDFPVQDLFDVAFGTSSGKLRLIAYSCANCVRRAYCYGDVLKRFASNRVCENL
jgi:hypothetical protein